MLPMPPTFDTPSPVSSSSDCIAILGRRKDTANYERFLSQNGFPFITTLDPETVCDCTGLLLPGGGDITPAFFGEKNKGSRNIDTELDILQLQALELCIHQGKPVLGICKGMQLINVAFGGTILQNMPCHSMHLCAQRDLYHPVCTDPSSLLGRLWKPFSDDCICVNSAHHQCLHRLGHSLKIIQYCSLDHCPEAIVHTELPILGLQWHPERLDPAQTDLTGAPILSIFRTTPSSTPAF
ncbi:MAG: gamma-glutamyl-gamma-aminobutyrate hydrolase family protein [Lachnospiraceae bacterium]|nr:gamma-glutamyl-gamma-aminobutyrate hydrolase family protein [Lachnospiraceae bacterium]